MATQSCPYYAERCIAIEAVKKSLGACIGPASGLPIKHIWTKSDGSQVTSMDYAVQVIISKVLTGADAGAEIIGEEDYGEICEDPSARKEICDLVNLAFPGSGPPADFNSIASLIRLGSQEKERGERFWVIDPIDGTKGFIAGKEYSVCLALIEGGQVVIGVTGCPNISGRAPDSGSTSGQIYVAVKGQGAYMISLDTEEEVRISTDSSQPLEKAVIARSTRTRGALDNVIGRIVGTLDIGGPMIYLHSQCKYCLLAQGAAHLYVRILDPPDTKEMIWDHASGTILVEEAGGIVTDFDGKPLDFSSGLRLDKNRGIIASSKNIHSSVVATTRTIVL